MDGTPDEGRAFAIFDHLSEPVVVTDAGFQGPGPRIIYLNDAFAAAFDHRPTELFHQPLTTVHPDAAADDELAAIETCCRERRTYRNTGTLYAKDGNVASVSWHIAPVFRDDRLAHLVCLVSEVSESPEFVRALRTSEKRYRNLFEHGRVGKAVIAPDGRFLKVNQSYCDLVGYGKEELLGVHSSIIIQDGDRDGVFARLRAICEGRAQGYQHEREYRHRDGHIVTVLVDVMPEKDEQGAAQAVVVQAQDISELKTTEAALRESENQLKAIFDHSPAEIYLKDAEGRYVRVSRQFEVMFGVRNEDVRGKLPHDVHYKELADRTHAHDQEVLTTGRDVAREEYVYLKNPPDDFPHILNTLKFPIRDQDEVVGLGAIVTDITETKHAENALRESEGRLRDFAEIAADWFWETDENLVITYVSDVHRQITGIPDEQIVGRTREQLFRDGIYNAMNPAVHLRTMRNYWDSMVEYSVTREDGREVIIHDRASPFFDQHGNFHGYRGVGRDITEQRRLTERIAYQATRDSLTGTVNRREFERCLDEAVEDARSHRAEHVLCFVDLDKFKLLNDTLGHAAGDHLLKLIVEKVQNEISRDDLLGRIGGDEFGILLRNTRIERAREIAMRISAGIRAHDFKWEERRFSVGMSVGLAPVNRQTKSSSELLARADSACYRAKGSGGVWVSDETEAARLRTYTDILRSLASGPVDLSGNFQLVGQPIRSLSEPGRDPHWHEILLRVVGDDGHYYRPFEFIRLAEQHGKMSTIDQWVMETAIASHASLVRRVPDAVMSINLSGTSVKNDNRPDVVDRLVREYDLSPENLCFEIGERAAMADVGATAELVTSLAKQGYRVALDEFGSGPASFSCLKRLPVHYIKIYGELIRELGNNQPDIAIVESINKLARKLGITAIAVQVESTDAATTLKRIGVDLAQGDALASTLPLEELVGEAPRRSRA
ncbi:MAG: PAS domain S-box protein [Gammaproteobacteria bacterium]|nr:PAS domain S-box protein [Gammaproteobacteria bacterium]